MRAVAGHRHDADRLAGAAAASQPSRRFAVGDRVCWVLPEAGVILVRDHQADRENTFAATVSERLAWRGHATVTARIADRRDAALSFAIGTAVAQRRGIVPGARIALQLQKAAICLTPADPAIGTHGSINADPTGELRK
ncbi:MAG: hypothetical protein V5B40_00335 [Candidatus Accumulibacter meliphilus]|uniref:hypothetical protein n=1 Tax=Candidatus Accumulibacter meliphilus TaxID=2211374 RepID=UPI002FC2FECD